MFALIIWTVFRISSVILLFLYMGVVCSSGSVVSLALCQLSISWITFPIFSSLTIVAIYFSIYLYVSLPPPCLVFLPVVSPFVFLVVAGAIRRYILCITILLSPSISSAISPAVYAAVRIGRFV